MTSLIQSSPYKYILQRNESAMALSYSFAANLIIHNNRDELPEQKIISCPQWMKIKV